MKGVFMVLLMTTVLTSVFPWVLQTTYTNIIPKVTDDVSLRCFYDAVNNANYVIHQLTRIRLLKLDNSGIWNAFAEIVLPNASTVTLTDASKSGIITNGHLGRWNESFLSFTWTTASVDTVGSYKCEITGFTERLRTNVQVNTRMVNITNNPVSMRDLLEVIIQMKSKSNKVTRNLQSQIESSVQDDRFELRYWPMGPYTILSPASGCPETPFNKMYRGFLMLEAQMNREPNHMLSSPTHLDEDVFKKCGSRNVVHFRFCKYKDAKDLKLKWPRGTYCIPYSLGCPNDFAYGMTDFLVDTSVALTVKTDFVHLPLNYHTAHGKAIGFNFCCRDDGDFDAPILLPNAKPFYLYRYKGKCQKVFNMNVTNEWIKFDTIHGRPNFHSNAFHADGDLNEGLVDLCYYEYSKISQP